MGKVVERLKWAGMTHIIPKIADGIHEDVNGNSSYLPSLVREAHKAGIKVLPYQYIYGWRPADEAKRAVDELRKLPFDGFVINAEHQYRDLENSAWAARTYCDAIRDAYPDLTLALSSYRFPSYHRGFPFHVFLSYCDVNMPQVYWMKANGTVPRQLEQTIEEYKAFTARQIIPSGAAFKEHGWIANADDQKIFIREVQKHGLKGCNWWEYYHTFHGLPHLGEAIAETTFAGVTLPNPPVIEPPQKPVEGDVMYIIELLGNLRIRKGPGEKYDQYHEKYALRGETHHSNERDADEAGLGGFWYKITAHGVTGWIYGGRWTRITEVEGQPEPEPPALTIEERVLDLERRVKLLEQG
jgi:hypothetical protein